MKHFFSYLATVIFALGCTLLLESPAQAQLSMPDKERTQTIVWIVEAVTFVITVSVALLVWRISKKDGAEKGRNKLDRK